MSHPPPLVHVEAVAKKFCRDLKRSLWYGLVDAAAAGLGRNGSNTLRRDEFWALESVSFRIERGQCLGLIGRNGAGKTTLLKLLNGLLKPDLGRVELRGRVAALIALGAGFNPLLTGRENIYVNGAVLGLTRHEIKDKLDEIADFAGIGAFIDAPVQSYSAGMQVRLGFAVATALRPDVLLLDEVLAVGDAAFRAKCYDRLARMRERAAFVLVSHDMDQVARTCSAVLLLEHGRAIYAGDVNEGIRRYQALCAAPGATPHEHVAAGVVATLTACDERVALDGTLEVSLTIDLPEPVSAADVRIVIWGDDGLPAADAYSKTQGEPLSLARGRNHIMCAIGPLRLRRGQYTLSLALLDRTDGLHLYWGDRVRTVTIDGPVSAGVAYTPALRCVTETADLVR